MKTIYEMLMFKGRDWFCSAAMWFCVLAFVFAIYTGYMGIKIKLSHVPYCVEYPEECRAIQCSEYENVVIFMGKSFHHHRKCVEWKDDGECTDPKTQECEYIE